MRNELDQYPTPVWQIDALTRRIGIDGIVFEPCAGDGAIVDRLTSKDRVVWSNDIDEKYEGLDYHKDASLPFLWSATPPMCWSVTNPPFNLALPILQQALKASEIGVAFLLRLSFLEPTKDSYRKQKKIFGRQAFLVANPPSKLIVLPRCKYEAGSAGTDSVTTAWMVWMKNRERRFELPIEVVPKEEIF